MNKQETLENVEAHMLAGIGLFRGIGEEVLIEAKNRPAALKIGLGAVLLYGAYKVL